MPSLTGLNSYLHLLGDAFLHAITLPSSNSTILFGMKYGINLNWRIRNQEFSFNLLGPYALPRTIFEPSIFGWFLGFAMKSKSLFAGALIVIRAAATLGFPVSIISARISTLPYDLRSRLKTPASTLWLNPFLRQGLSHEKSI